MYLFGVILILLIFVYLFLNKTEGFDMKEGFDPNIGRIIPIRVSETQDEISVPNTVSGTGDRGIEFDGNITANTVSADQLNVDGLATTQRLVANGDTHLNQVKINGPIRIVGSNELELGADTGKGWDGNGSISYKTSWDPNALNMVGAENGGPRKVHLWDDVIVDGKLNVKGSLLLPKGNLVLQGGGQTWTMTTNGLLHFLHNTELNDYTKNKGHLFMRPNGDLWLARSTFEGWITDNLQSVSNYRDEVAAERAAAAQRAAAAAKRAADAAAAAASSRRRRRGGCAIQ